MPPLTTYYSWFPGEDFLTVRLPNYDWERRLIVYKIIAVIAVFLFILPFYSTTKAVTTTPTETTVSESNEETSQKLKIQNASQQSSKRRAKKSSKSNGKKGEFQPQPQTEPKEEITYELPYLVSNIFNLSCILSIFGVLFFSTNNLFPARTLLRAPVFTREECQSIIDMAHRAAERNAKEAERERGLFIIKHPELMDLELNANGTFVNIKDGSIVTDLDTIQLKQKMNKLNSMLNYPNGWKKDRHSSYPTTDLNLVTDPFTVEDREWLGQRLDARLAPLVERGYGIARGAIRANDIFVVRYDATEGQPNLRTHTDSSHLSFNILLNDEFEGGGTRFFNRMDKSHIDLFPSVGEALLSHAMILHEGMATTKGTRYILVGFDQVDAKDPLTGETTNLSLFSSWLNFSWMQVRFREGREDGTSNRRKRNRNSDNSAGDNEGGVMTGSWKENRFVTSLFGDLDNAMTKFADRFATFRTAQLVNTENAEEYIQVMDRAMEQRKQAESELGIPRSRANGYSSWFKGQQINLDVFGSYVKSWNERKNSEEKFREETL